ALSSSIPRLFALPAQHRYQELAPVGLQEGMRSSPPPAAAPGDVRCEKEAAAYCDLLIAAGAASVLQNFRTRAALTCSLELTPVANPCRDRPAPSSPTATPGQGPSAPAASLGRDRPVPSSSPTATPDRGPSAPAASLGRDRPAPSSSPTATPDRGPSAPAASLCRDRPAPSSSPTATPDQGPSAPAASLCQDRPAPSSSPTATPDQGPSAPAASLCQDRPGLRSPPCTASWPKVMSDQGRSAAIVPRPAGPIQSP